MSLVLWVLENCKLNLASLWEGRAFCWGKEERGWADFRGADSPQKVTRTKSLLLPTVQITAPSTGRTAHGANGKAKKKKNSRANLKLRDNILIINRSVINYLITGLSLVLSSCFNSSIKFIKKF